MCRWFDSGSGHVLFITLAKNGILAQSVEHLTFNQVVRGSNPRCLMIENGENVEKSTFSLFCVCVLLLILAYFPIILHLEHLKSVMQDCDCRRNKN